MGTDRPDGWRDPNWLIAVGMAATAVVLPRALRLNEYMPGAFLTPQAYVTMILLLVSSMVMTRRDPANSRRWALVIGVAPLVEMIAEMIETGPGNLWPIAIILALFVGFVPSFLGARLARTRRPTPTRDSPTDGAS